MKRKRSPHRDGEDNAKKGQDTSLPPQKRVKNENVATENERRIDGSVNTLDLPVEVLSIIL
jgi:hypothetical protein